jgi:hypothetical protein
MLGKQCLLLLLANGGPEPEDTADSKSKEEPCFMPDLAAVSAVPAKSRSGAELTARLGALSKVGDMCIHDGVGDCS